VLYVPRLKSTGPERKPTRRMSTLLECELLEQHCQIS